MPDPGGVRLRLPCPFCGGADLSLVARLAGPDTDGVRCRSGCPSCRAAGVAVEAWVLVHGLDRAAPDENGPGGRTRSVHPLLLAAGAFLLLCSLLALLR